MHSTPSGAEARAQSHLVHHSVTQTTHLFYRKVSWNPSSTKSNSSHFFQSRFMIGRELHPVGIGIVGASGEHRRSCCRWMQWPLSAGLLLQPLLRYGRPPPSGMRLLLLLHIATRRRCRLDNGDSLQLFIWCYGDEKYHDAGVTEVTKSHQLWVPT